MNLVYGLCKDSLNAKYIYIHWTEVVLFPSQMLRIHFFTRGLARGWHGCWCLTTLASVHTLGSCPPTASTGVSGPWSPAGASGAGRRRRGEPAPGPASPWHWFAGLLMAGCQKSPKHGTHRPHTALHSTSLNIDLKQILQLCPARQNGAHLTQTTGTHGHWPIVPTPAGGNSDGPFDIGDWEVVFVTTCDAVFSVMNKMCVHQCPSPHYLPVLGAQCSVRGVCKGKGKKPESCCWRPGRSLVEPREAAWISGGRPARSARRPAAPPPAPPPPRPAYTVVGDNHTPIL